MPTTDLIQRYGGVDLAPIGNPNTLRLLQSVDYEIPQLEPAPQSQIPSFQEWYEQWGHTYPNVDVARSTYFDTDGAPIAGPVQPERMSKARHLFNVGVATPVYGAVAAGFDAAGEMREGWHRLKQHVAPTSVADVLTARLALWLADESDPRWREENMRRALQFGKMWDQAHVEQGVDRLHALAMTIREAAPQGDPALEESLLWTHLPAAIGSFSTFIAATSVAGAMTGGVGAGLTAAAMAGAHGVSEQRQRLQRYIDEGLVTREQANNAAMVGVVPGLIQVFPVMRAANRLFPGAGRAMHNSIGRWLVEGGKGALEEAFAEGLGVIGQNAIQRYVEDQIGVDDPVGLLDDFVLQSGVGGAAGFIVNFGLAAIGSRVRGRIHPRMTEREVAKVVAERMDQVERQAAAEGRPATPQDYLGVQNTEEVFTLASIEAELAAMGRMTDQQRQNYIIERAERQHVGREIARERAIERERALSQRMATWEQMLEQAEAREAAEAEEAARLERQRLDEARLTEPLTQPLVSRSELEAMQALVDEITRNQEQIRADATDPAQVRSDERFEWPRRHLRDLAQWWGVPASLKMLELEGNRIRVLGQIRMRELENAQRAEYWRQREQERQAEARRRRQRPQPREAATPDPETVAQPEPVAEPAADPVVDPASQAAADVIETPEATPNVASATPDAAPVPVPETVPDAQDTDAAAVDTDAGRVEQIQRQFRAIGPGAEAMANNLADMVADGTIRAIDSDLFMAMHLYLGTSDAVLRRISVRSADVKDVSGRERAGRAQAIREEGQPVRFVVELVQRLAERSGITAERADLNSFTMLLHEYFHAAKHIIFDTAQIEGFDQATIEAVGEVGSEQAIAYFMATTANGDRGAAQYMASSVEEMQAQLLIHRALNRMMGAPDTPLPGTEVAASRLGQMLDAILNRFRSMLARLRVWGLENNITTYLDQLLAGRTPEQPRGRMVMTARADVPEPGTPFPQRPAMTGPQVIGRSGALRLPNEVRGEQQLPYTYVVVEAADVIPTHDPTDNFRARPEGDANERPYHDAIVGKPSREMVIEYSQQVDRDLLLTDTPTATDGPPVTTDDYRVVGGNGRAMILQLAYANEGADAYRQSLLARAAHFGLDRAVVEQMQQPVLVRRLEGEPGLRGELSRILNDPLTTGRTADADAVSRGRLLTPEAANRIGDLIGEGTLAEALASPSKGMQIVRVMRETGAWSPRDETQFIQGQEVTPQGKRVIEDTFVGAVVQDAGILNEIPASVRNMLIRAAGPLLQIRQAARDSDLDFDQLLQNALEIQGLRRSQEARNVREVVEQSTVMFYPFLEDRRALVLADAMGFTRDKPTGTPVKFARTMREVAAKMREAAAGDVDMFTQRVLTPAEAFDMAMPEPDWLRPMDTPAMLWGPDSTGTSRRTLPPGFHVPSMGTRVPEDARAITPVDVSTLQEGGRFVPPDATEEHRFSALMEALTERLGEPEQSGMSEARYWYTDNGRSIRLATHPQYYAFEDTGLNLEIHDQQGHLQNLEAGFSADAVADWAIRTNGALAPVDVAAAMQRQRQHRLRTAIRFAPSPVAKRFVDKLSMDEWREAVRRHGGRPGRRTKLEIAESAIRLRLEIMTPPTANPDDVPAIAEQAAEDIVAQRPLPELPPNIRAYTESLSFGPLKELAARLGAPDGRSAAALRANIVQHVESMDPNNMFGPELPDIGPQGRDPQPAPNMDFVGKRVSDANARADLSAMPEAEIRRLAEAFNIPRWEARDTQDLIGEIAALRSQAADLEAPSVDVLESDGGMMNRFKSDVGTAIKHFTDFPINDFFIDMIDRLERSGDAPILKQAARAFRHMASDTYELMGELSEKLDAALRLVRHFRFDPRAENRALAQAVEQLQQPVWVQGQNHGETLFWMAMEDRLPPGVELTAEQRRIIAAGQDLLRQGGMMHEREGTMRFNHRTGEWEAFRLSNRSVAPRMGTPELWDIQMRGGPELEAIIEAIASAPENDTTVEQVRAHFEQVQQDWMRTSGDDAQSAIARINAEFFREYYYFPSVIRHPSTNAVIQLLETNPFSYFERYAVRTAARLAFNRHMGQAEQQRQQLQAISQELMRTQGNDDALASLVRGAHGLPIQAKYFAQPGRWTHRAELTLSHLGTILRAGILSMTWPQNLWEPLGRILALAGGPMKQDFFTAVGNLWLGGAERRAVLIHTLRRGAQVDHWVRNFSFDPTRPIESAARFMSEFSTFLVRTFWREQSYLASAVAQAKTERMRRGEGTESDIQDVMVSLGLSRIEAERMARGDGDDAHYLMLSRRGGAFTTNDPQLPIEMSRAEHRRILRTMIKFSTYGYMGARWLYNTIRRGYLPAAKAVIQNPTDNAAWRQFMVANAKFAGVNLGLTAAGSLSYFTMALITGGMLGLRTAWEEFEEDTWAFLRDSWMYSMFGGPFATILRISQSPEQARAQGLMSYIWPGAMINELYDLSTGSGRYRDRSFFGTLANAGTDGRLAVFADRFAPWNRMIWAGLAMIGIGRDEFDMQVADRAYWRARLRIAPMGFSGAHADSIIDEIRQQQRLHGEFRMHMRRGYIAMTSGRSPHLHIQEALRVEGKTNADIARHLRQQKRLSGRWGDPTSAEYRALRARIGDKALQMLRRRDAMFEYWAQTYEPPKQKRRK